MLKPWTDAEEHTALSMRGQHTNREIADTLERSTVSVEKFFYRHDRNNPQAERPDRQSPAPKVSSGIASRLGVEQVSKTAPVSKTSVGKQNDSLEPVLIVPDAHRPYHCKKWWDLLMQVGRFIKPQHVVIIGDFADFYSLSAHDQNPKRAAQLDVELDDVDKGLDDLDSLGATDKLFIEGNHEDRLRRHLMKNPQLSGVVSTEKLLKLRERGWHFVPYKDHEARGRMHFTHDVDAMGRTAVYKALETYQHSVVTGHTHRLQYVVEGSALGECKLSAMFGWGGDVDAVDYKNKARARKEWAHGFGIGYLEPSSGFVYLVPVPVVHGTCMVNGRLFRAAAA